MRRVKLVVAYDGTNYCGWQIQPNGVTIEEKLTEALNALLGEEVMVIGASRTDSGVHARGNVAVFDTNSRIPADKICLALNQRLPKDIVIQESCEVPLTWHPRKCNSVKTYEYKILNRRIPLPDCRLDSYFYYWNLDVDKMRQAASYLVGEHDFKSFCSIRTQVEDTVRTVYRISVEEEPVDTGMTEGEQNADGADGEETSAGPGGRMIRIRISGNGFLYNMVRIIAGTLLRVGSGYYPPEYVKEILESRDRAKAGPKAPAHGLTLVSIKEESELKEVTETENSMIHYKLIQREVKKKGKAYLIIYRCRDEDFESALLRLTKRATRNGARRVYVYDVQGRIHDGMQLQYFTYRFDTRMDILVWKPEKYASYRNSMGEDCTVSLIPMGEELSEEYIRLQNDGFRMAPNSRSYDETDVRELLKDRRRSGFIISDGERNVGMTEIRWDKDQVFLDALAFLPEYQKKGYGTQVMRRLLDQLRKWDVSHIFLTVASANHGAYRLYESMGFEWKETTSVWYVTEDKKKNRELDELPEEKLKGRV